jgi:hypothetical protein
MQKSDANSLNRQFFTKIPCKRAFNREFEVETGSYLTAHTTIQSYETANPCADSG